VAAAFACLALVFGAAACSSGTASTVAVPAVTSVVATTPPVAVTTGAAPSAGTTSVQASATVTAKATTKASEPTTAASPRPTSTSASVAGNRTLTLVNKLSQTIWPAVAADPNHPIAATGWVLAPGASVTFAIPDHWDVRVWARAGCTFTASGTGHCLSGDCQGKFQCGSTWGEFPSTLAEFNLNAWQGMDFYDVSLVEGNNLPMWINQTGGKGPDPINANGCSKAGCTRDANSSCPTALQVVRGGAVTACKSSCLALGGDQMCCTGAWASRAMCDPAKWPVDSAAVFKKAEPFAYSYVDDDATSVLTCTGECGYRITWGVSP
jgi:Thaumatin family